MSSDRAPLTAMSVAEHLADLAKELDVLVKKTGEEDLVATTLKEQYLRAYASAWRAAVGSVEARKQIAIGLTADERMAAEIADCQVRDYRRRIDALRIRIDVGRSLGTTVRAEVGLASTPLSPYGR